MSKTIRMLLLGLVGAIALSSAGTALAAYTSPSLRVTDDRTLGHDPLHGQPRRTTRPRS